MSFENLLERAALAVFCLFSFCSETKAQNFGVGISPEYSYRNLVKTDFIPGIDEFIEESDDLSEPTIGFTAEAFFVKPFAERMSFETGISLSRDGYNSFVRDLSYESLLALGLVNSSDPGFENTTEIETQNRFISVGIPFRLAYVSDGDKLRFAWSFGVTPEYFIESKSTRIYRFSSGAEETFGNGFDSSLADFTLTAAASVGVEYAIDRETAIRIEPIVRYNAFPVFDRDAYEVNLFSYGLSLKYLFQLNLQY